MNNLQKITLICDDEDMAAIHRAIALRQSIRSGNECMLPDTNSELSGAILADICRSWEEQRDWIDEQLRGRDGEEWKNQ